jgi:hypothetical protein
MMTTTVPGLSVSASLDANWSRLDELTSNILTDGAEHSLQAFNVKDERAMYRELFNDARHDRYVHGKDKEGKTVEVCLLGMRRAPASKNRHHNIQGGLVIHLLQMWEIWIGLRGILRDHNAIHAQLNDQNIWKCIVHHDLNKIWKYKLVTEDPWSVDYAGDLDRITTLLGDTNKVLFLLNKQNIRLPIPLHNALITAEGGFSTSPRPSAETVLAKVAYLLDELSANVVDRLQTGRFWDSKQGGISENGEA